MLDQIQSSCAQQPLTFTIEPFTLGNIEDLPIDGHTDPAVRTLGLAVIESQLLQSHILIQETFSCPQISLTPNLLLHGRCRGLHTDWLLLFLLEEDLVEEVEDGEGEADVEVGGADLLPDPGHQAGLGLLQRGITVQTHSGGLWLGNKWSEGENNGDMRERDMEVFTDK